MYRPHLFKAYVPKLTSEEWNRGVFSRISGPSLCLDEIGGGQERIFCARDHGVRWAREDRPGAF